MTSELNEIYSRFYLRIEDYNIVGLEENIVSEMMSGWMKAAVSVPYVRRLFDKFAVDDELGEIEYELKFPVSDDEDKDFVEEVIVLGMVVQWLKPRYNSTLNTNQFFSNNEQKFYSQANHMAELKEMYHQAKLEQRKLIRDRGYIYNKYISET